MSNSTPNLKNAQHEHLSKLLAEREKFRIDETELLAQKAGLGFSRLGIDEFLAVQPDADQDHVAASKILQLQKDLKALQQQRKALWVEESIVQEFNSKHAVIHIDQTYILSEKINAFGCKDFSLESRQSFRNFYEEEVVLCSDGKMRCVADIWLKHPLRRKYAGIVFDPTIKGHMGEHFNIWKGFAKEPIPGTETRSASLYWAHVKNNICSGNEILFEYVRKWMGMVFQYPAEVHTALVLCGSQGVGKNRFVEPLGVLFGQHYILLDNISQLISNFNNHLKNAVLVHANEALWGGNKKDLGTVKAMITEHYCLIESKGKDRIMVRNFKHIILSSNEPWPVSLDADDRRFLVLPVSEQHKEDEAYFAAIVDQLNNGGYEALLYDLLHIDLTGFKPRQLPENPHAFDIKICSANSAERYLYEAVREGNFSIGMETTETQSIWERDIDKDENHFPKELIFRDYRYWCQDCAETPVRREQFCKTFKKFIPSAKDARLTKEKRRWWCFTVPNITKVRADFAKAFKTDRALIFPEDKENDQN